MLEAVVALGIFSLISVSIAFLITDSLRYNQIVSDQLEGQNDLRQVLQEVVDKVRRAEESSTGAYPIESASKYDLRFYANIDNDGFKEKVHFWLDGTILKKGIIKPSGNPLTYNPASEQTVEIAHNAVNVARQMPVFTYYNESYTGSGDGLSEPVTATDVHVVRVQLEIEKDPVKSPVPVKGESVVQIRNLKTN